MTYLTLPSDLLSVGLGSAETPIEGCVLNVIAQDGSQSLVHAVSDANGEFSGVEWVDYSSNVTAQYYYVSSGGKRHFPVIRIGVTPINMTPPFTPTDALFNYSGGYVSSLIATNSGSLGDEIHQFSNGFNSFFQGSYGRRRGSVGRQAEYQGDGEQLRVLGELTLMVKLNPTYSDGVGLTGDPMLECSTSSSGDGSLTNVLYSLSATTDSISYFSQNGEKITSSATSSAGLNIPLNSVSTIAITRSDTGLVSFYLNNSFISSTQTDMPDGGSLSYVAIGSNRLVSGDVGRYYGALIDSKILSTEDMQLVIDSWGG